MLDRKVWRNCALVFLLHILSALMLFVAHEKIIVKCSVYHMGAVSLYLTCQIYDGSVASMFEVLIAAVHLLYSHSEVWLRLFLGEVSEVVEYFGYILLFLGLISSILVIKKHMQC